MRWSLSIHLDSLILSRRRRRTDTSYSSNCANSKPTMRNNKQFLLSQSTTRLDDEDQPMIIVGRVNEKNLVTGIQENSISFKRATQKRLWKMIGHVILANPQSVTKICQDFLYPSAGGFHLRNPRPAPALPHAKELWSPGLSSVEQPFFLDILQLLYSPILGPLSVRVKNPIPTILLPQSSVLWKLVFRV